MARKSRKNMPVAVAEPTDNLTAKAVLSMDKEAKPYQVGIYARLSFESEANKERDTVDTQIAYIREFINSQDDMVEVEVYADISVTGTTFERPEFDRMIQDIRAGRINTVITRDLSRLGRNYVEAGNYIERVFPFLDVRYIAITDDFDTARPGTDLSVPLKNIVNEYYSKDLSKKVETGKHSIWAQGGFSEGTPPYGYYRATDGSRKLLIDEEVSDNVVRIFNMFLDGEGYGSIAKTMQSEGILSPPKYRFYKAGKTEFAEKAREWHYSHVKEILQGEYYIGNIVHGKQRKALDTGRKNKKTDKSKWQRVENAHEPIIDKDTFYRVQERIELIRSKHLEGSKPNPEAPKKPDNILVYKTKCACCGGSVLIIRHADYKFLKNQLKKDGNLEWYFVVWYLAATGARVSELIRIKIEHVQLGYFDLYSKGGKLRRLFIPKILREETLKWLCETQRTSGYLFLNRYGDRITTRGISQQLKNYADKYGLDSKVVYPHSFRHRYAKNFLEKYNDIALLADLMGHESIETTRIYLRRTASEQQALVDKIVTW